jgi:hypothetical protein
VNNIEEKLDQILELTKENNKILKKIFEHTESDSPGREFLLNLGADILGDFLINGRKK